MQFWKFDSKSTIDLDPPKSAILSKFSVFSNFKSLQKSQIGSVLALPGLKRCEILRRIPKKVSWRYSTNWDRQLKKTLPPPYLGVLESASLKETSETAPRYFEKRWIFILLFLSEYLSKMHRRKCVWKLKIYIFQNN